MSNLKGSLEAKEIIERGIAEKRNVLLIGDPDVDGVFALKLLADLFNFLGVSDYMTHINSNRKHGFNLSPRSLKGYLVVMADFCISNDEMLSLINEDCLVVVLDHHKIRDDFICYPNGVIINNQYSFEDAEDRYLSGAGVVYEVFSGIYPQFKSSTREAMVGITLLSDVRAIENNKARAYLRKTYGSNDDYIRYLIEETMNSDFGFGMPRMDRGYVDFTFSPTINAMFRFNKGKEVIKFIFGGGLVVAEDYHKKQQNLIRSMKSEVDVLAMPNLIVLAVDADKFDVDISNFIGLLCSRYRDKEHSAMIFAYRGSEVIRASFRGRYEDVDYNTALNKIGVHAEGHDGAFGIIDFTPNESIWEKLNNVCRDLEANHSQTYTILKTANLSSFLLLRGMQIATDNCYVRDMYRTFIKYIGKNVQEVRRTYKRIMFTDEDYLDQREEDGKLKGESYYFERDENGNLVTSYIEYKVDGKVVKSYGVELEDGIIMPILEKGYISLIVQKI